MLLNPTDHLPQSVRDQDCIRRDEEIERRKVIYRESRAFSTALRTVVDRQSSGQLTRADGAVLAQLVLQNLRACVRKQLYCRPTRAWLASQTGYSERAVSKAITSLKDAGFIVVARYAKGGRMGHKGKGISTEFRSGCLQFLTDQLTAFGYRLPKSLIENIIDMAKWAAAQVGARVAIQTDSAKSADPTGKKVPGIVLQDDRAAPGNSGVVPVLQVARPVATVGDDPPTGPPGTSVSHCNENNGATRRYGALRRPPLSELARAAMPDAQMVPMPPIALPQGGAGVGYLIALWRRNSKNSAEIHVLAVECSVLECREVEHGRLLKLYLVSVNHKQIIELHYRVMIQLRNGEEWPWFVFALPDVVAAKEGTVAWAIVKDRCFHGLVPV
jgi:hypothetical protein